MLLPYVKESTGWNVPDDIVKKLWDKLVEDKIHTTVFYDADIKNRDQFLEFFQSPNNLPTILLVDDSIGGFAWLNCITGKFAFAHFAFYRATWGKHTDEMGKEVLKYWFNLRDANNERIFKTLLGSVPDFNQKAINFVKRIGFVELGTIPDFVDLPYRGERRGMTLLYGKP